LKLLKHFIEIPSISEISWPNNYANILRIFLHSRVKQHNFPNLVTIGMPFLIGVAISSRRAEYLVSLIVYGAMPQLCLKGKPSLEARASFILDRCHRQPKTAFKSILMYSFCVATVLPKVIFNATSFVHSVIQQQLRNAKACKPTAER
jgi:hypothetical protein